MLNVEHTVSFQSSDQLRGPLLSQILPHIQTVPAYIPGEAVESFHRRSGVPVERIVKLNTNESPYGPVPAVLEALSSHRWYNQYPDTQATGLKAALANYTGIDESQLVLGQGSMDVLSLLWHIFLSPGDSVLCCTPTYSLYRTLTALRGVAFHEVPRRADFSIDVERMLATMTSATKMVILCSPNNPTGGVIEEHQLRSLLETGRIIVVDEAYVEFSERPGGLAPLVAHTPNLIVVRTFSKWAGLAGLRIGYGLVPTWLVPYLQRLQSPFEVNVAGHLAAVATLTHLDEAQANIARIIKERERLFQVLTALPYLSPLPSQGNFILAQLCDEHISLRQIIGAMEAEGILLRYFPRLVHGQDFIRITVGTPEHTERLAEVLQHIS